MDPLYTSLLNLHTETSVINRNTILPYQSYIFVKNFDKFRIFHVIFTGFRSTMLDL